MLKIIDIKNNGLTAPDGETYNLPQEFLAVLPSTCVCGSELEISETLTQVSCPNPRCITKVTQRLADLCKYLGILGLGEAKCRQFFECVRIYNPYAIFAWTMNDAPRFQGVFSVEFLQNIHNQLSSHREFTLPEFVKTGFLPGIQDSAFKLFKDYTSIGAFYADLDAEGIALIARLLGLSQDSASVLSTYETLCVYRQDLIIGEKFVTIRQAVKTLNVCISTAVGAPFKSKSDFVAYINSTYADKFHMNWLNAVTQSGCDYLICADKEAQTSKAVKARKYGVPIVTGAEFEALVKSL